MAEARPLDLVLGIGLRADDPRANDPRQWRGNSLLGEAISAVREAIREVRPGWHIRPTLTEAALPSGMLEFIKFRQRRSRTC